MSVYFKTSGKKTPIDPGKISEDIFSRGAPDLKFSNPAGTGFTGFAQKFRPEFRPDLPDLR